MDVENYLPFSKSHPRDRELRNYLESNNIPVTGFGNIGAVEMLSSNPHWPNIEEIMKRNELFCTFRDTIFTKEELATAAWMRVRTMWRTGFPQPMDGYKFYEITYTKENYCEKCGIGLKQIDLFRIKKAPSWGRRNFFSLFWVGDEFFVSENVRQVLLTHKITGVSFQRVLTKGGKRELDGIYQLRILHTLNEGLINSPENLKSRAVCEECGRVKSITNIGRMEQFRRDVFEDAPDIVKTGDYFGVKGNIAPEQSIIINQKVYQTITEHHLDRNLRFYPIELV